MKKIISLVITLVLLAGIFASCGGGRLPDGMDGKTGAQIILANERLNSQLLKNEGNIFETGTKVFNDLARIAEENLVKYENGEITYASSMADTGTKTYPLDDGSKVEVTGTLFEWSGFKEYSNSHEYFASTTENIRVSAMLGADLIDSIKRNVRVVDKWIKEGSSEYYLHVDENYELLFERRTDEEYRVSACIRYKDENGNNVYEVYEISGTDQSELKVRDRMLYIPGVRFEFSTRMTMPGSSYYLDTNFIAENTKGYWEMINISYNRESKTYTTSFMALKDDVCYDAMCDPLEQTIGQIDIISPNRNTDILTISETGDVLSVELAVGGFDGIEKIYYLASPEEITNDPASMTGIWFQADGTPPQASSYSWIPLAVQTSNGTVFKNGDKFLNDKLEIRGTIVAFQSMGTAQTTGYYYGYTATVDMIIGGEGSFSEKMALLAEFLDDAGIKCRYDLAYVESGTVRAREEAQAFLSYYKWNGHRINSKEELDKAYAIETERVFYADNVYNEVKDAEVINRSSISTKDMYFGTVNAEATGAKYAYRKVTIDNLVLSTDDTVLFVENEPYVIKLALLGEDGLLTHLEYEGETEKQFVKADTFKLEQKNIDITLPEELAAGKYTLVAYISTADGIRSTAPDVFALGDIQSDSLISGAVEMRTSSDNGALAIEFRKSSTVSIALESEKPLSYSELYTLISEKAYEKGVIVKSGALIEGHNAAENKWTALDTEATEIGGGMYRIEYENKNADKVESGTIMITFGVAE